MAELAVQVEQLDGRPVLAVSGELDLATVGVLRDAIAEQVATGPPVDVVLDLAQLTFLDSSGLGALLEARAQIQSDGGQLRIVAVGPAPARVIAIAGLSSTFGLPER